MRAGLTPYFSTLQTRSVGGGPNSVISSRMIDATRKFFGMESSWIFLYKDTWIPRILVSIIQQSVFSFKFLSLFLIILISGTFSPIHTS